MKTSWVQLLLVVVLYVEDYYVAVSGSTDSNDAVALRSLKEQWQHTPPNWDTSDDPCDSNWDGVNCTDSRVTSLKLSSMGLQGKLEGDIGDLTELRVLDLSYNRGLNGPVPSSIESLKNLTTLILAGCSFTGNIPTEIGNLKQLTYLALNSNNFTGEIPASLGMLSNLSWLDVADNQLSGRLPVSTSTTPGLDQLHNAKHFHFNKNKLSGDIPGQLFNSNMKLIHILFNGNQLSGRIPSTLGLVNKLEVLRLDRNLLVGEVPSSLYNLTKINELNLANNKLTGPIPNLTEMIHLFYVDLSNNSFSESKAPIWFSTIQSLTTLVMECGGLQGEVPKTLFSSPELQEVRLKNNSFNSTLDMGDSISERLQLVDLEDNQITKFILGDVSYKKTLKLSGNPVCNTAPLLNTSYCQNLPDLTKPYSTPTNCGNDACHSGQRPSPQSCYCAYPYQGNLFFRAPFFRNLSNRTAFESLEQKLWKTLGLTDGSVSLRNAFFNDDDSLQVHLELFPSTGMYFERSEIQRIGFDMSNQTFKPPSMFGPFYFIPDEYPFPGGGGSSISKIVIIGISVGCVLLLLMVVAVGAYAFRQKKRAERAIKLNKPFASWGSSTKDSGGAPELKGARQFSFHVLKSSTNNFSESNEIGSGGYGKVYKGILPGQQIVAIKRAQQGSMQGGLEFKTEIELLSRVHHKNLVRLIGFCYEQGEQMLIYEYVPNGTLRDSLSGKSGVHLDWKRRVRVALCSARGLAYLHELADPPIIHRDVKSSNILLDENLSAKVADFGLSKLVANSSKGHVSTQVKGTLGYMDPEYYLTHQLSERSDVYSYGVVMLELVTAKQPLEKGKYIVREVQMAMNPNEENYGLSELIDPVILRENNLIGFRRFLDLAMQCVKDSAADRPIMSCVVKEIETILQTEGVKTDPNSASSSATDYGLKRDAPLHPCIDTIPKKEKVCDSFDYSGGYTFPAKVEPK